MRVVSEQAIVKRIKRKLAYEGESLVKMRDGTPYYNCISPYCIVNDSNWLVAQGVDLAELGRELGVLAPHEYVEGWEEQSC